MPKRRLRISTKQAVEMLSGRYGGAIATTRREIAHHIRDGRIRAYAQSWSTKATPKEARQGPKPEEKSKKVVIKAWAGRRGWSRLIDDWDWDEGFFFHKISGGYRIYQHVRLDLGDVETIAKSKAQPGAESKLKNAQRRMEFTWLVIVEELLRRTREGKGAPTKEGLFHKVEDAFEERNRANPNDQLESYSYSHLKPLLAKIYGRIYPRYRTRQKSKPGDVNTIT